MVLGVFRELSDALSRLGFSTYYYSFFFDDFDRTVDSGDRIFDFRYTIAWGAGAVTCVFRGTDFGGDC